MAGISMEGSLGSLIGLRRPAAAANDPVPFAGPDAERLGMICAVWPSGRCLVARGYDKDKGLLAELRRLKAKGRIPQLLKFEAVTLDELAAERDTRPAEAAADEATDAIRETLAGLFAEAAAARASDIVFENNIGGCRVHAIVNDARLPIGEELLASEGKVLMGYLFHAKDEGSSQTSYQRGEFQGFSIRAGGEVPLPATVSGLRCQRGPHDPDGDHLYCRLFYLDQLADGMTMEKLGFTPEEAAVFSEVRMSLHGGIFLGGSTGDGKSTTLAVNLALQTAEFRHQLNLVTLEDPVEYRIKGAIQIAVPTTGSGEDRAMHFRRALMHFCRVHPASGMVSEIRDADAALQVLAAIDTGHQVWTTIHVDNANAILFRLLDMGVEPATLIKPGNIKLLMKQTLLPMLCGCALTEPAEREIPDWLAGKLGHMTRLRFRRIEGCSECLAKRPEGIAAKAWSGYTGQRVAAEMIRPDADWLSFVARRDPIGAWRHWTDEMGGTPLGQRIWKMVAAGLVDPFDALTKGARPEDAPATPDALQVIEGTPLPALAGPREGLTA